MKLLITGANGFLGQRVAERLRRRFRVNCLLRRRGVPSGPGDFIFSSYGDEVFLRSLEGVEVIVHIAAQLHGPREQLFRANVEFTRRLVECAPSTVRRFIYISSENVTQGSPDIYSRTKALGEDEVRRFPDHTIIRPTIIYGPEDRKYVGKVAALVRRLPFVPVLGRGNNRFQFIHIDDVAMIVERAILGDVSGTYTVAGPDSVTYNDFVRLLMEVMNVRKPVIHLPLWCLRPAARMLDLLMKQPPLTPGQLVNLVKDRCYDISEVVGRFGYTPTPLRVGLTAWAATSG